MSISSCSSGGCCGPAPGDYLGKVKQEQKEARDPLKAAQKELEAPKLIDLLDPQVAQKKADKQPGSFSSEKGDTYSFTAYA